MASLTPEVQQLIDRGRLGTPAKVYGPPTGSKIFAALFILVFACAWFVFVASLTGSPLAPQGLLPLQPMQPPPPSDSFAPFFPIFQLVFPLLGLVVAIIGLWQFAKAVGNRNSRVALCKYGAAYVASGSNEIIRWEDVLTITHRMDVNRFTTYNQQTGMNTTRTTVRHKYTVHCRDGRKILFDSAIWGRKAQDLAEEMEIEAARQNRMRLAP